MSIDIESLQSVNTIIAYEGKQYTLPKRCPHCNIVIAPATESAKFLPYDSQNELRFLLHKCTYCSKRYITTHLVELEATDAKFITIYPTLTNEAVPKIIENFSPRFVLIYQQAAIAEQLQHFTISASGYRMAFEVLAKDYALYEYPNQRERIVKSTLNNCLQEFFPDMFTSVSADTVKILGNDYVNYVESADNMAFIELKYYLSIFLLNIEMKLKLLSHPDPFFTAADADNDSE